MEKKISLSINPVVNLILHVLCCIDPSLPSKPIYAEKAGEWILKGEREFFEENFKLEQTGKVSSTAHFALLFQIPAYFSSSDMESLREVIELMKSGSLNELKNRFLEKGVMLDAYMPEMFQKNFFDKPLKSKNSETIETYGRILNDVYSRFYMNYWETIVPEMEERRELLQKRYFDELNLIKKWEEKTRLEFPYPTFIVELADSIKTLGTSLMAERGAFSHWVPTERIFTLISHEVGTHTLFQERTIASPGLTEVFERNPERMIRIFEGLSVMINLEILKEEDIPSGYTQKFKELFTEEMEALKENWSAWKTGRISTSDLIRKAYERLTIIQPSRDIS